MLTRIEIDGFKTFEAFSLDLQPLTAVVGPNASGKSNLFDAIRFLSLLAQFDIRQAMQDLRGQPLELFRQTPAGPAVIMKFAVEVALHRNGVDPFGKQYEVFAQRLRYELDIGVGSSPNGGTRGVYVQRETCFPISKRDDRATFLRGVSVKYNSRVSPFIRTNIGNNLLEVRQDGRQRHGRPVTLSLKEASKTALSTITTAEFPHLFALKDFFTNIRFLEINPEAARAANDRFEDRRLKKDASNLSAALAALREDTATDERPDGALADVAADLASLIPSVSMIEVSDDPGSRNYSFDVKFTGDLSFSSRVISDGTLRLLALLTVLNDPDRRGALCFEEPENGVHEGRIPLLVDLLRRSAFFSDDQAEPSFQVLINTHSPKVMTVLFDTEIVAADSVTMIDPASKRRSVKTRMRTGIASSDGSVDPESTLTRSEVERFLQHATDTA